jgi:hypothetical protein
MAQGLTQRRLSSALGVGGSDLVVWDNFAVQHARPRFHGISARRTLRRVSTTETGVSPARAIGIHAAG